MGREGRDEEALRLSERKDMTMQLEIAIFVTSLVVFLLTTFLAMLPEEKLNTTGSVAFILSIFGLAYSTAGFF